MYVLICKKYLKDSSTNFTLKMCLQLLAERRKTKIYVFCGKCCIVDNVGSRFYKCGIIF